MMASVPHVTSGLGLRKFQADGFLLTRVYIICISARGASHKTGIPDVYCRRDNIRLADCPVITCTVLLLIISAVL